MLLLDSRLRGNDKWGKQAIREADAREINANGQSGFNIWRED
jgi:hypothetical protein